jgi:hypothetical protein
MSYKWTPDNENKLLLILVAHYSKTGGAPHWETVASLMGEEFTANAICQHYTKKLVKRDVFVEAKEVFNGSSLSSPKKRKRETVEAEN